MNPLPMIDCAAPQAAAPSSASRWSESRTQAVVTAAYVLDLSRR